MFWGTLSFHLAAKLWITKSFSLGHRYSSSFGVGVSMYCYCVTFQSSPMSFCPTTTLAYHRHWTILILFVSWIRHIFKVSIPHEMQSPIKQALLCQSFRSGFSHKIEFHKSNSCENEVWWAEHYPTSWMASKLQISMHLQGQWPWTPPLLECMLFRPMHHSISSMW